jgi:hypothetical protein
MTTLYAATDGAVLAAHEGEDGWRADWHRPASRNECLAADRRRPDRVFVGTVEDGLRRSRDGGETWETVADVGDRVTAATVDPHDPDAIWLGTEPSAVHRSLDGGDTWHERPGLASLPSSDRWSFPPRPHTHHVRWIAVDRGDPDRLAVAIEAGAFLRSPDAGQSWLDHAQGARRDTHTIATHPDEPGRLYVAAGDGYAESPDWGETWRYPQDGLDHRYVWSVAVEPDDPETVVVSAARGARSAHDPDGTSFVYRRRGGAWQRDMDGLPGPDGLGRPVLASGSRGIVAVTNHGCYRRGEDGWERLAIDWPAARRDELPRGLAVIG